MSGLAPAMMVSTSPRPKAAYMLCTCAILGLLNGTSRWWLGLITGRERLSFKPSMKFPARPPRHDCAETLFGLSCRSETRQTALASHSKGADMTQLHNLGSCTCCGDLLTSRFDRRQQIAAARSEEHTSELQSRP